MLKRYFRIIVREYATPDQRCRTLGWKICRQIYAPLKLYARSIMDASLYRYGMFFYLSDQLMCFLLARLFLLALIAAN